MKKYKEPLTLTLHIVPSKKPFSMYEIPSEVKETINYWRMEKAKQDWIKEELRRDK